MSIPNTTSMKRRPTHPGEMLREDFLPDYGLTATSLAEAIDVSHQSIHELVRERRRISPEMALRLAQLFGNSPYFPEFEALHSKLDSLLELEENDT